MNINFLRNTLLVCALATASLTAAVGAEPTDPDPFELDFENNINTPEIPQKKRSSVKARIDELQADLERAGFKTSKVRQGEVLMVTIACERLFRANDVTLTDQGKALLRKFRLSDGAASRYKIIIAVHTDNTGEDAYADSITASRANSIDDFLNGRMAAIDITTVPYGLGRDEQLVSNDSLKNRAKNRRVEIYIVPTSAMFAK